jgi:uncharacterized protein (TIGR00369 family)
MPVIREGLSGLEYFKKMIAREVDPPPMLELLGITLAEAEEGRVVFTATVNERHYNGMGVAHGGFAATLLDSALGCAINTMMPPGRRFTTLELTVNLTRPLTREVGPLHCEATVIHIGGRVATSEGRIRDAGGKLYAHGTTTCIVVEAPRGKLEP